MGRFVSRDQTRTEPSEPPVTRVEERSCSWPTSEVWPCRMAMHWLTDKISFWF